MFSFVQEAKDSPKVTDNEEKGRQTPITPTKKSPTPEIR